MTETTENTETTEVTETTENTEATEVTAVSYTHLDVYKRQDWSIHDKGDGNPHVHLLLTMRPFNPEMCIRDRL